MPGDTRDFARLLERATESLTRFRNRTCTGRKKESPWDVPGTLRIRSFPQASLDHGVPGSPITITRRHEPETPRDPRPNSMEKSPRRSLDCCPVQIYNQPANRFSRACLVNRQLLVKLCTSTYVPRIFRRVPSDRRGQKALPLLASNLFALLCDGTWETGI